MGDLLLRATRAIGKEIVIAAAYRHLDADASPPARWQSMTKPSQPRPAAGVAYGAARRGDWPLDPAVTFINHGGYGVVPNDVLRAQAAWRERMERNPMRFMAYELPALQREAAAALAAHLNARSEDLVFVDNATAGCNAVLRSLSFAPGDEILITNLAYNAVKQAVRYVAERSGAAVVEAEVPLPLPGMSAVVDAVATRLGPRTRLAIFDHIASHSALVLPVAALARLARATGARVLVDGAHAAGQVPLDLAATGADWYVGNCHKWLMAPRGCGFLWAGPDARALVHPLAISHGYGQGFVAEFDWTGTRDPTPFLSAPAGIAFHERLGGPALMARNAGVAREAARLLVDAWGTAAIAPAEAFAAMAVVRLPLADAPTRQATLAIQRRLSDEHHIEAAITAQAGALWVRIAAQAYNELGDYQRLASVF
jgi:isopenicillin-N epimerase